MFAPRYFAERYFAPRYFPPVTEEGPEPEPVVKDKGAYIWEYLERNKRAPIKEVFNDDEEVLLQSINIFIRESLD